MRPTCAEEQHDVTHTALCVQKLTGTWRLRVRLHFQVTAQRQRVNVEASDEQEEKNEEESVGCKLWLFVEERLQSWRPGEVGL